MAEKGKGLHALITSHKARPKAFDSSKIFKDAVIDAFYDAVLTKDEAILLDGIRKNLGLSVAERDRIFLECQQELGSSVSIEAPDELEGNLESVIGPIEKIPDRAEDALLEELKHARAEVRSICVKLEKAGVEEDKWKQDLDNSGRMELKRLREKNEELSERLALAASEQAQANWLLEEARAEFIRLREENEELCQRLQEAGLEATPGARVKSVKKVRPVTTPMPPPDEDGPQTLPLEDRPQTLPLEDRPQTLPLEDRPQTIPMDECRIGICAFCGKENNVPCSGTGTQIFMCTDCGKKSFLNI